MGISLKTHKILWGKSGNKCSFPDCKIDLVMDESETDDPSVVGEEAHIVARKKNGPRGISELTKEQRDKYNNLILLCSVHHKVIDDQETTYTIELLKQYKKEHENWVNQNLSIDKIKERDDIVYAGYIDTIIELADINSWKGWTSYVFGGGSPSMRNTTIDNLRKVIEFILSRVWPKRYPKLETAIINFKNITNDFLSVFNEYAENERPLNKSEKEYMVYTEKFYKIREWDTERYNKLLSKYEYHCLLVEDLLLEMTRVINHIFDLVRLYIFPSFRMNEGVLLIEIGPFMDLSWRTYRTEYKGNELENLYPGLRKFMEIRENRDQSRGREINEDYFPKTY